MLFQRLKIDRVGPSKHLIVQIQQQDTRRNSELFTKLTIKRVESGSGVFIVNFEYFSLFSVFLLLVLNR